MDEQESRPEPFPRWKIFFSLYLRNMAANLIGFGIILLLNYFTPLTSLWLREVLFLSAEGVGYLVALFPTVLAIIAILQHRFQCPVCSFLAEKQQEGDVSGYDVNAIQRRLLNFPLLLAITNLAVYTLVPVCIILFSWFLGLSPMEPRIAALFFFRSFMIGLITATLSFFIVESYTRSFSIPMMFPEGGLIEVEGAVRMNVFRRIRLLNLAGTLTPMLILVVTLGFVVFDVVNTPWFSNQLAVDIFLFSLVLCAVFIYIGFRLNALVGRSIVEPLKDMLNVVQKVEQGDFSQRIPVVSNDELGELAEAGNQMIQGLAERERVRESFGRYVTPEIRDKILSGEIPLDGEKKRATMLFADLRNFTRYVEENPPEIVILSMRDYFTAMEEAVRAYGGLVLQYVGDELEAVFGVPLETDHHADKAVQAALEMRKRLIQLNRSRQTEGEAPFQHGVGICSGPVLAGNTGSRHHPSYALIGDTVNLASRVQELTKEVGCDILITRSTKDLITTSIPLASRGKKPVKGYPQPLQVYEVL
jgi:class 3 adenylate cyclase